MNTFEKVTVAEKYRGHRYFPPTKYSHFIIAKPYRFPLHINFQYLRVITLTF